MTRERTTGLQTALKAIGVGVEAGMKYEGYYQLGVVATASVIRRDYKRAAQRAFIGVALVEGPKVVKIVREMVSFALEAGDPGTYTDR